MRIRQHVNPLDLFFEKFRGETPVLDSSRELEVEIGCADAQFLFERAARDPDRQYIGLEIREDLVRWVNDKARTQRASVTAVWCHAQLHVKTIFAPSVANRVYVNFPDPWFKRRHHVRRMVDAVLARTPSAFAALPPRDALRATIFRMAASQVDAGDAGALDPVEVRAARAALRSAIGTVVSGDGCR